MEIKNAIALAAAVLLTFAAIAALQEIWGDVIVDNRAAYQKQLLHETLLGVDYDSVESFTPTVTVDFSKADFVLEDSNDARDAPLQNQVQENKKSSTTMQIQKWWRATNSEKTQAVVVQVTARGYGGDILFLLSFNRQGQRLRARIIRHKETPGIADFLSHSDGADKAIDGVSGATITSNALSQSARQIAQWIRYNKDMLFSDSALSLVH